MDDVWDIDVWNELNRFFPNNRNESRILVTTRISNVAVSLGSQESYSLDFLNEEKSWNLFCHETFAQESCPYPELEEIGKSIAKSCKGLPLTTVVIGGLLANSNMTREYWESVAENVNAFRNSKDYKQCLQILSLSYNSLPIHLKPCFLYMRVFREDSKVNFSNLTKLWIAEGFLKSIRGKSLEEAAETYLRELIDRSLILSHKFGDDGNIITCGIHDVLRDLCLREYEKEHFIYAPKVQRVIVFSGLEKQKCFICGLETALDMIDLDEVNYASQLTSVASVWACNTCKNMYPSLNKTRLVRVKLVSKIWRSSESREKEILHPTSLRYLEVDRGGLRKNTKFEENYVFLFWKKREAWIGLTIVSTILPVYKNLESLLVEAKDLTLEKITFPTSLKELSLYSCNILWEKMITIGSLLPNLQKLELDRNTFEGHEWNQVEGEFPRLKVLKISHSDLKWWRAENIHFPKLESLILCYMKYLEEIPSIIGDIPTLHSIYVQRCNDSLIDSAKQIVEEQHDNGNENLQLYINKERYQVGSS
ncbi:putative late blight resistance proteinR1C-3 [Sesamum alatum]|uniref:Late blight resistance proteinR1C-3 n=1 Tax=Sesamum alatum TaxID=300844 RepID=A0AAE1XID7_9LAMI|nr:putative late blight resistance proteinR1C-3 [Sesamum alatum]